MNFGTPFIYIEGYVIITRGVESSMLLLFCFILKQKKKKFLNESRLESKSYGEFSRSCSGARQPRTITFRHANTILGFASFTSCISIYIEFGRGEEGGVTPPSYAK